MEPSPVWRGTTAEGFALQVALAHNCGCTFDEGSGARTSCCAAHEAFVHDQKWLDGLVCERRRVVQLLQEEMSSGLC